MTAPYYEADGITLYLGDCREFTEWLTADVLITDPPYGTMPLTRSGPGRGGYGRRQTYDTGSGIGATIAGDDDTGLRDEALRMWGDRPALVFGSPRMPDPPIAVADRLVWDKKRPGLNGGPWRYRHESIYVTAGFVRHSNAAVSVLTSYPDQTDHIHAKPVGIMQNLIAAAPAGAIADPFAGSGSTLVACATLGRPAIGVEIEERYCEVIARRLAQGVLL